MGLGTGLLTLTLALAPTPNPHPNPNPNPDPNQLAGRTGSVLLRNLGIDETSDKSYQDQIRDALSKNAVRVIDLFREWDEDGNGELR